MVRLLSLVLCLATVSATRAVARPQVSLGEQDFDFGRALAGTVIEHAFVLNNASDSPFKISELRLTPPLTLVSAPSSVLPGATGVVRVRLDTSVIKGLFEGRVMLSIGDARAPLLWTFAGTVYQMVEVAPPSAF